MASATNFPVLTTALDRLAAHYGIEPGFRDARGEGIVTSPETQKRLLSAMGVEANTETDALLALNRARNAAARSALPSVVVVRPDAAERCWVTMAKPVLAERIAWHVELEDGAQRNGMHELAGGSEQAPRIDLGELSWGYHRLHLPEFDASATLIVTPGKCWLAESFNQRAKLWGIAAQLYLLRSDENWGIGDFADLLGLVELSAELGCEVLGLNPLHQMFLDSPEQASPYSPLTRLYLNVLYIAVANAPGYSSSEVVRNLVGSAEFKARLAACRAAPDVDYSGVVELKLEALRILYAAFGNSAPEDLRSFESFQDEKGVSLRRTSIFQALRQHFANEDPAQAEWHSWPDEYRDAASEAVQRFAEEHADEINFFDWLQWVADEQLARAAKVAEKAGMAIGLYRDLAVGCDQWGAETWANPDAFLAGAQVGAPPDIFNPAGQDWGLPPFHPNAFRDDSYRSFVELIRANMRHAGGLRIDHVMGLQHLYCIPKGCSPAEGAYVGYPLDDLIGILALESQRHRCLVVGEDLGTVPEGFREKMAAANILSYRVLFFEQDWDNGRFLSPDDYPRLALAVAGSHDLPTLIGWWEGRDIDLKERLGLYPTKDEARSQRERREQDRASILEAFRQEGVLKDGSEITAEQFTIAAHDFLARTGSALVIPQLDDLLGEADQVNVPATSFENPNWRRKYRMTLEDIASSQDAWRRVGRLLNSATPRATMLPDRKPIPRATYRLQLNKDFGFDQAAALAPYLAGLGISHVYCSPYLRARPGSTHGYDIVSHTELNPELGNTSAFGRMVAAFRENGLGQILDFVPNHMGVGGADNPWWLDVLEWGPDSQFAGWFDIDWESDRRYLQGKLLVPFLGEQYGAELQSGALRLRFDAEAGSLAVWAYDSHKLPISPLHYERVLGDSHPDLERLGDAFAHLSTWRPHIARRASDLKLELAESVRENLDLAVAIQAAVDRFNGDTGELQSWSKLDALIRDQHWRAAHFRVAADDINYRRFFNINDLAGVRMELPQLFDHAHSLVFRLLEQGVLDGIRLDHVDGLLDPKGYCLRLREKAPRPFYLIVEKILAPHENLRDDWDVEGTTGYEFANLVTGLLNDPAGQEDLTRVYADFTGERTSFSAIVRDSKMRIMENEMASELNVLAREAARVARSNPRTSDFTNNVLQRALKEIIAVFPVYRTYVDGRSAPTPADRRDIDWAMAQARRNGAALDPSVFDFLHQLLTCDLVAEPRSGFSREEVVRVAMRAQQYSGPVMAKGLEDTAFYRYNRMLALNEVGGHPDQFSVSVSAFHHANAQRAKRTPYAMLSTATHDTKRGEDTRARLAVLSEIPDDWAQHVALWSRMLRARSAGNPDAAPPDRNDEYAFYQLLLGAWPARLSAGQLDPEEVDAFRQRIKGAITKAMREAKVHTTWAAPNAAYEDAVLEFISYALDTSRTNPFLESFSVFQQRVATFGALNSLIQVVLKLTVPGVPDVYQGAELWDFSMVDPDNRRPVDYDVRKTALASLESGRCDLPELLENWRDGRLKLRLMAETLALRRREPELFMDGSYEALHGIGPQADRLCAFMRAGEDSALVTAVALYPSRGHGVDTWGNCTLTLPSEVAPQRWIELFSGCELTLSQGSLLARDLFASLPVALLTPSQNCRPPELSAFEFHKGRS